LGAFGYTRADIPELVTRAADQQRVLVCSPRPVEEDDLRAIFERSFATSADL
jgi:alcohol dehydrogenase class IV